MSITAKLLLSLSDTRLLLKNTDSITSTGAKISVNENIEPGIIENTVELRGSLDNIIKAFEAVFNIIAHAKIRIDEEDNIEEEDEEQIQIPETYELPFRLVISYVFMKVITGTQSSNLSYIRYHSKISKISASSSYLPNSSEKSILIQGTQSALSAALRIIYTLIIDNGELQTINAPTLPYLPIPAYGVYGFPKSFMNGGFDTGDMMTPSNPYGVRYTPDGVMLMPGQSAGNVGGGQQGGFNADGQANGDASNAGLQQGAVATSQGLPGQPVTQQIFIPNDMVGAIIGKGGSKINEIRQMSGSHIKINEPLDNSADRLVSVTGTAESNQLALYMLYTRLDQEKHRV